MDYREYQFHELARDPLFRKWVLENDADLEKFWNNWLERNPSEKNKVLAARALLLSLRETDTGLEEEELDDIAENILVRAKSGQKLSSIIRFAASVFLVLGVGLFGYFYIKESPNLSAQDINEVILDNFEEHVNEGTRTYKIELADGTFITLYPRSQLKYSRDFDKGERVVYLTGQAFFEVARDIHRPFWVITENVSTQVVGTSFMVEANDNSRETNVEVKEGKVLVYSRKDIRTGKKGQNSPLPGMMITRNQKVSFNREDASLSRSLVEDPVPDETLNEMEFRLEEEPIANVFHRLEKAYGITINFDDQVMAKCFITADLEGERLYRKMDLICSITHSSYEIVDGQIIVYSKGCY